MQVWLERSHAGLAREVSLAGAPREVSLAGAPREVPREVTPARDTDLRTGYQEVLPGVPTHHGTPAYPPRVPPPLPTLGTHPPVPPHCLASPATVYGNAAVLSGQC